MEKRKERENQEDNAQKRRRLLSEGVGAPSSSLASFDSLNSDCLVNMLSYLCNEEMNTVAICSKACQEARSNESLDQTRTGTIVCTEGATIRSVSNAIVRGEWNNNYSSNRTHLRIENVGNVRSETGHDEERTISRLEGVVSLDFSCEPQAAPGPVVDIDTLDYLFRLCPNLTEELDLSGLEIPVSQIRLWFTLNPCPNVKRMIWTNFNACLSLEGHPLHNNEFLTELNLDDSCLLSPYSNRAMTEMFFESPLGGHEHMLRHCQNLERLSIKGTTYSTTGNPTRAQRFPLTQDMIIKMVRRHPMLQWLRSDLSAENVAMLEQERPDITFVSD